ncbi:HIT-like protein [Cristinia sonorae]|uniref:HIT-like protein n=1 Tax=Cristinia sonorae TaxID=1940300 RepID=A0A8K0UNA9_9AGAR|nr:HIT-like protein [Cristinia sonorae]
MMGALLSKLWPQRTIAPQAEELNNQLADNIESQMTISDKPCIFCNVTRERGFDIVFEDTEFIAFKDHNPSAVQHFLVIPRQHIATVKTLDKQDSLLVQRMADVANSALDQFGVEYNLRRLGFHIPPFNSVQHLHLHAHGLPYKSLLRSMKYIVSPGSKTRNKGFSWFVHVEQAIQILERGQRIGVLPC